MTTLNKKIVGILEDEFNTITIRENYTSKMKRVVTLILKAVHENPSIKQGQKLLKEKREQDVWDRGVKNKLRGK